MTEDRWQDHAKCLGVTPETMFPERGDGQGWREARKVCDGCPVLERCLSEHLDEMHGCFGGTSPRERVELRMKLGRPRRPPEHGTRARYNAGCRCFECRDANTAYGRGRSA